MAFLRLCKRASEHANPVLWENVRYAYGGTLPAQRGGGPWEFIGLTSDDVEPGDTLMDWRYALPGQAEQVGYRFVYLFTRGELGELAERAGFEIVDEFESDGEGGRLGEYQVWKAVPK
jgi:hypothetical protein